MKKSLPLIAFVALGLASASATGATLVWGASLARNGFDSLEGPDVSTGSLVRAGSFLDLTDQQIRDNATNLVGLQFLNAHFTEFGVSHIGEGVGNTPGHFSDSDTNITTATLLAGKQIYIWVLTNSTNPTNDLTKASTAQQHGIFYMSKDTDADWAFPSDPQLGSTTIAMRDLTDTATSLALVAGANVVVGELGPGTSAASGKPDFTLREVPEPSFFGLFGVGTIAFLNWRRRREV